MTERRWGFLEDNPAVSKRGWFPPAEEVPELADLRMDHERLMTAFADALRASGDVRRQYEAELEARRAAHERAFVGGEPEPVPEMTVNESEVAEAIARAEAAKDALQTFVRKAVEQVNERAPRVHARLDDVVRAAEAKRADARAILAEADRMEAETRRLWNWLARVSGASRLGHYAYEDMAVPMPPKPFDADDMRAALAGGAQTEVMTNA